MKKYMCVNCGGGFYSKEMYFDTEYDCDLCSDCYTKAERKNNMEFELEKMKEEISYLERLIENADEHDIDSYGELILKIVINKLEKK